MENICQILLVETGKDICKIILETDICKGGMIGAGGALAVLGILPLLAALGFTSGGIAAGSLAAKLMSISAVSNGGGVAAGGVVALLQSLGAGGLSGLGTMFTAGAGGSLGWLVSAICNQTATD